jgi:hypothetical protein
MVIVNSTDARLVAGVVEHELGDVRQDAELSEAGPDGPADVMEAPRR